MPVTAIQPIHWNAIIERIREGYCVPFLGAGVNASNGGYQGLPLGRQVAMYLAHALTDLDEQALDRLTQIASREILRRLVQIKAGLDDQQLQQLAQADLDAQLAQLGSARDLLQVSMSDLARVALHIEVESDHDFLMQQLRDILPDSRYEPSPLLKTLARLPLQLIVTTNYDRLLERALGTRPYELVVQPIAGFDDQAQKELQARLSQPKGPIVYKIHGTFHDDAQPPEDRLIITEEDYIEFLTIVNRENMGVPALITEKLVGSTILFLGYSLQDWDFRTIYKALIEPIPTRSRPRSFAIQRNPPDFWVRYWERKGVTILDLDLFEFADGLQQKASHLLID